MPHIVTVEKKDQSAFLKALGEHFARIRRSRKISQEKLSFDTGLDVTTISKIERGLQNVSSYNAYKIALALKVSLKELYDFRQK